MLFMLIVQCYKYVFVCFSFHLSLHIPSYPVVYHYLVPNVIHLYDSCINRHMLLYRRLYCSIVTCVIYVDTYASIVNAICRYTVVLSYLLYMYMSARMTQLSMSHIAIMLYGHMLCVVYIKQKTLKTILSYDYS